MAIRGKKNWFLAAGLLAVVLFFALHRQPAPEPVYDGKPLSYWFQEAGKNTYLIEDAPSTKAIRALGAAAVPYLTAELAREEPSWSGFYSRDYLKVPVAFRYFLPKPSPPDTHQETAAKLLYTVGLPAREALPQLITTYDRAYARHFHLPTASRPDWSVQLTNPPASMLPGGPTPVPETNLREWILMTLIAAGGEDRQIAPLILCAIQEPNQLFRTGFINLVRSSTNLASAVTLAEPAVLLALRDPVPQVRAVAANMLGDILPGHPEVIPPLLKAAEDPDQAVRQNALESLVKAKTDLGTLLPVIALSWTDGNDEVRHLAGLLLLRTAGVGLKSLGAVSNALDSANARTRAGAAQLLGNFGARAKPVVPKLTSLTNETTEPDAQVRREAIEALKKIAAAENPQ